MNNKAKEAVRLCNMILNEGVRIYENVPELVEHWINKGIAQVKEVKNPWSYARQFDPTIKVAYLVESHRSDIELVKGLNEGDLVADFSDSFVIERNKNNRLFFITKDFELTWRKENAWKFNSEEDIKNEIKNNRLLELTAGDYYRIVKYSDVRSH